MVSGFLTSPNDQERIISGDARLIRIASNSSTCPWDLSKFSKSFKAFSPMSCNEGASVTVMCSAGAGFTHAPYWFMTNRLLVLLKFHVDTERADFFNQYVKGFRHSGFHTVVAIDDVFVHLGTTGHIIRFNGKHFLQGVRGTVSFQRPHFHLSETLT